MLTLLIITQSASQVWLTQMIITITNVGGGKTIARKDVGVVGVVTVIVSIIFADTPAARAAEGTAAATASGFFSKALEIALGP
jgi:hypothetical protein